MTREEILSMEATTEMDTLIAEKVMELEMARPIGEHYITHDMALDAGYPEMEGQSMGIEWEQIQPKPYSSDISAAWEVVVKMENDDYWWTAEDVIPNSDPVVYSCTFSKGGKFYTAEWEFSMPLAICRAALLAVMENK